MNLKHNNYKLSTTIVVLFLLSFQFLFSCKKSDSGVNNTEATIDNLSVVDTIFVNDTLYLELEVPYIVLKDTIIYRDLLIPTDTAAILNAFLTKKVNIDTLKIDSGFITIIDSISGGNIVYREYFSKIKSPPKENLQNIKEEPRGNLYLGLNGGLDNPNYVYSLGTSLFYKTPNDKIYEIGLGVWNQTSNGIDGSFIPYIRGGVYWKLNFQNKNK